MLKSDLHPPRTGLNADPMLYGVAAGLAELFPPAPPHVPATAACDAQREGEDEQETQDRD